MRIIGRFPDQRQVGALVDTLRNNGFDRGDMIISDLAEDQKYHTVEEAAENMIFIKSETDGLGEFETFASGVKGLKGSEGILVAVKTPKRESDRIRSFMEQSGAVEIIQD